MGSGSCIAGMEVPITGSDSVKFVQLSLPCSTSTSTSAATHLTRDVASCSIIGNPPSYFTWKICRSQPNVLEIMEFCGHKEFPKIGLQIVFPEALFPFAVICKNEMTFSSVKPYLLHAMTVSGVAYLIKLEKTSNYVSSSHLQSDDFVEFNTLSHPNQGSATAVTGMAELMVVGRSDGSVGCFQLGILDQRAPGFVQELRDDAGLGRLWGVLSRELSYFYSLQDAFVSEQLFQGSENSSDDLLWLSHTVLSSSKDQISPFVSSVYLRRLLLPGVYHRNVLRVTLRDFSKHFTDSEFDSLTVDGLKNEILSVIQHEYFFPPFSRWELIVQFQYFRAGKPFVLVISVIGVEQM
ncbi:hypothetical protein T459_33953 [Capsicum annuum]|uniref:Nucleoporin Nup120/160 beta-propeller domain-containing protein n=1 Tax=Capsicum annuum TaxID=4072 RepID=A0A2G2XXH4_CAPAN|nr:hypothetical protein T459_33953 [Capsicum annuum]